MLSYFKRLPQRVVPVFCCLLLVLLLVACESGTTSSPPAPTSQPSPTAIPTNQPSPTPLPVLMIYQGKGYAIGYPRRWKITSNSQVVTFSDATGSSLVIAVNSDPNGAIDAATFADTTLTAVKNTMSNPRTETLPPTTTVGGESWVQKSISGLVTSSGVSVAIQTTVITHNHPASSANTQNFIIEYGALQSLFATANTSSFQPMLQSFRFT